MENRRLTIDSMGNIVPKPYGPSRWDNPKRYECAHKSCSERASVLKRAGEHSFESRQEENVDKAHNCCGSH